ncbi:MAG: hypothetical protein B6U89_07025, partial [Desulfurococcales archaeon ex4484_58]
MKEIIEYILAAVIILSIIPIYNYIVSVLYSPPELKVEETVVHAFTDQVVEVINEAGLYGNLTSPLVDLADLIKQKLPYYTSEYGFYVEMVSSGIINIIVENSSVKIYTISQGNVTLLLVYDNGSTYTLYSTNPSLVLDNGTYVYVLSKPDTGQLVYAAAILDTRYYRYIDHYMGTAVPVHIGNINNSLVLVIENTTLLYTLPDGEKGLPIDIISYSKNGFQIFNKTIKYGSLIGFSFVGFGWSWRYGPFIEYGVFYNSTSIEYYAIYNSSTVLNGVNYSVLPIYLVYNYTIDQVRYRYYLFSGILTTDLVSSEQYSLSKIPINAPIYNLPIIVARAPNGTIIVGNWYPHKLAFGETIPEGIPVTKTTIL